MIPMKLIQIDDRLDKDFPELGYGYVSCGMGWYPILKKLIQRVLNLVPNIKIVHIKEKFGCLRFYVTPTSCKVSAAISDFEALSGTVCESCGTQEGVTLEGGWIKAFCPRCRVDNG